MKFEYDIIVVGAGHAGCEAAAAAANMGCSTLLITMDMTKFAHMSCNPAVGGVAKGQIVREIDALGGQMGIITDRSTLQFRMLNRSKGPAMWSPRAQCDKALFSSLWRQTIERLPNLYIWQDSVVGLLFETLDESRSTNENNSHLDQEYLNSSAKNKIYTQDPDGKHINSDDSKSKVIGVKTKLGVSFHGKAVILTAGTFLEGLMHVGRSQTEGGRAGDSASHGISAQLAEIGFQVGRMKTGTPARLDAKSINFDIIEKQSGDSHPTKFSYSDDTEPVTKQLPCYLVYTSQAVHDTLRLGFADSPLFNGTIKGIGPRYCPSIEDKLRTFAEKSEHQLFLEPEGFDTNEYYLNGFSSSLPWDVQISALQKIKGFENIHLFRPGYAIEYDYFPPTQLQHSLETKLVHNLYFAGQVNGTTGYEEAGAQGLMAGINAVLKLRGEAPLVLRRDEAYIGVLIDDLVTKGVDEPYRMFTSRAEYRILLRQDNADLRLTPISHKIGLADDKRHEKAINKKTSVESLINFARRQSLTPANLESYLKSVNSSPLTQNRKLYDLILRNGVTILGLAEVNEDLSEYLAKNDCSSDVIEQAEIQIKYHGYIERERHIADKMIRLENIIIHSDFDFNKLSSLSIESRQKLSRVRPSTIGQASRIPGVNPADINVLLVYFGR